MYLLLYGYGSEWRESYFFLRITLEIAQYFC